MSKGEADYTENPSLEELNISWRTEANAPEILPFNEELVTDIKQMLESQQEIIDKRIDDNQEFDKYFTATIFEMDMERARYSLTRYLRTRILKIEKGLEHILSNIEIMDRLSTEEREFASKLNNLNNSFFEDNASVRLQNEQAKSYFDASDDRLKHAQPKLQDFIICQPMRDITVRDSSLEDDTQLSEGGIYFIRYEPIKEHVVSGDIRLL